MINTKDLEKIIGLCLYTAYIQEEQAVSIMLISDRPEAGKSKVAMKFYGNKGIAFLSDVTAFALWRDYHKEIESGTLKHLIVPEFLAPLSRKSETVQSFIATLQMLIEEGIMEIHTGFLDPIKLKAPSALGAIVCMPRREFMQRRQGWELSGFLSRFIVVSYTYNSNTIEDIFESIASREYLGERNIKLDFPTEPVKVEIPPAIAQAAKSYVFEQTEKLRKTGMGFGFRTLKHFLCLLCADVIMQNAQNGNPTFEVSEDNLEKIKQVSYLINEEFNALRADE